MEPIRIRSRESLQRALGAPTFVILKHSTRCAISSWAWESWLAWRDEHPDVPTAWIDVVEDRALARLAAERTGVPHASPQVLLLQDGRVTWSASHGGVTRTAIADALASAPRPVRP